MGRQMRYQRGQKLTAEERGGGDEGAGRGNPNVPTGAYGGAQDAGQGWSPTTQGLMFSGPSFSDFNLGGYGATPGDGGNQQQLMQSLMDAWSKQQQGEQQTQLALPAAVYTAQRQAQDPVGWRAKMKDVASMGPTFDEAFKGRMAADKMSPEAIMASQGNTAANQWAQLGANKNIDVDELKRLNAANAGRFRTYM